MIDKYSYMKKIFRIRTKYIHCDGRTIGELTDQSGVFFIREATHWLESGSSESVLGSPRYKMTGKTVDQLVQDVLKSATKPPGYTTMTEHQIDKHGAATIKHKQRRLSAPMWKVAQEEVEGVFEERIIEWCCSPWRS